MQRIDEDAYIHYHLENYRKYGITRQGKSSSANTVFDAQKLRIQNLINKNKTFNVQDIEDQLNANYGLLTGNLKSIKNGAKKQEVLQKAVNAFQAELVKNKKIAEIDMETLSVYIDSGMSVETLRKIENIVSQTNTIAYGTLKGSKVGRGKDFINTKTINSRVINLIEIRNLLISELSNLGKYNNLVNLISQIETEWALLSQNLQGRIPKNTKGIDDLIGKINQAVSQIRLEQANLESGKLAEVVAAVMLNLNTLIAMEATDDVIQSFVDNIIQEKLYSKVIPKQNGINVIADVVNPKRKSSQKNNIKTSTTITLDSGIEATLILSSQNKKGKVDITFKDNADQILGASVKNYTIKNGQTKIHINSGSNLLPFLHMYPDFTYHYANIMASHPDNSAMSNLAQQKNLAKEAMYYTILGYSLVGGFLTDKGIMDTADVLILHVKGVGFKAYSMSKLLEEAAKNVESFLILDQPLRDNLPNRYVKVSKKKGNTLASRQRVQNLLAYLRGVKIEASLKASALGYK